MPYVSKRKPDLGTYNKEQKVIRGNKVVTTKVPTKIKAANLGWNAGEQTALSQRLITRYGTLRRKTSPFIQEGAKIIPAATETSQFIAQKAGLPTSEPTSALLATFATPDSQRTEHEMGRVMGLQLLDKINDSKFNWHIQQANRKQETIHQMQREPGGKEKYAKEIVGLEGEIEKHRIGAGIAGTPLGQIPVHHIFAASKMLTGEVEAPLENVGVSRTQGREASPIRFSESSRRGELASQIETGGKAPKYPVDADIFDAIVQKSDIPYSLTRGFSNDIAYRGIQGVGERAYETLRNRPQTGLVPGVDKLSDFLGAIWLDQRRAHISGVMTPEKQEEQRLVVGRETNLGRFVSHNPQTNPRTHGLPPLNLPPSFGL
jgi:hypothetical protein